MILTLQDCLEGTQEPGVPVCVFRGPITRLLGGELPIPGPHPLEPDLQIDSANTRAYKNTLGR